VQPGALVPPWYDSLLAKLIASGKDRAEALSRLRAALARCDIGGVTTTVGLHAEITATAEFEAGGVDTTFLDRLLLSGVGHG
jgi:acetyl-CoA carboxylase, biotin carboxylase subunit